uniref:Uncharacterized protein n=1 Tax=Apteryx owenii TaxID=8824 RepID=A0A8B9NY49_APTOW
GKLCPPSHAGHLLLELLLGVSACPIALEGPVGGASPPGIVSAVLGRGAAPLPSTCWPHANATRQLGRSFMQDVYQRQILCDQVLLEQLVCERNADLEMNRTGFQGTKR